MATAASTVMVTRTVEMQPSMDSQDSFLKDGMNINGAVARVHTTTEKWKGLRPRIRPGSHPTQKSFHNRVLSLVGLINLDSVLLETRFSGMDGLSRVESCH